MRSSGSDLCTGGNPPNGMGRQTEDIGWIREREMRSGVGGMPSSSRRWTPLRTPNSCSVGRSSLAVVPELRSPNAVALSLVLEVGGGTMWDGGLDSPSHVESELVETKGEPRKGNPGAAGPRREDVAPSGVAP